MDSGDNQDNERQEDKLRVDLLDRLDLYRAMSIVFFNRLTKDEKVDALLEVIEVLKGKSGD